MISVSLSNKTYMHLMPLGVLFAEISEMLHKFASYLTLIEKHSRFRYSRGDLLDVQILVHLHFVDGLRQAILCFLDIHRAFVNCYTHELPLLLKCNQIDACQPRSIQSG